MMAGLDVAAGVIAVVDISAKVAGLCYRYSREVADAKSDIERLKNHVERLLNTFKELQKALDGQYGDKLRATQHLRVDIDSCCSNMYNLEEKLKIGKGRKAMHRVGLGALSWPLTRSDTDKAIERITASQEVVKLALQIDTATTVQKIDLDLDLAKLPSADGAAFDSYHNQHDTYCHPNTRVALLDNILRWSKDPRGKCIYWLSGMAGTGKSTIARTLAHKFAATGDLAASFFFKRGEGDRGSAKRFFPTIANQMVRRRPKLVPAVRATIEQTPDISEKQMKDQFEGLVLQPLTSMKSKIGSTDLLVVVIDALDECENDNDVRILLGLLSQAQRIKCIRFRILVTSRPEMPVRLGFNEIGQEAHQNVHLHEIAKDTIDHDISAYLTDELKKIQIARSLEADWPGAAIFGDLVQRASPLFIFAATTCRFLGDPDWDPQEQLEIVLRYSQDEASKLDPTYLPVFDRLLSDCDDRKAGVLIDEFIRIVGSIVVFQEPLPVAGISRLLEVTRGTVNRRLSRLHSVLDVPIDAVQPVRLLHLSFRDFLLDPTKQPNFKFWVDEYQAHTFVARQCLQLLSRPDVLKQDICGLGSPGALRSTISNQTLEQSLPAEVQYACRYWIEHAARSKGGDLWDSAYKFFKVSFLYWLEAMCIMRRLLDALAAVTLLQKEVTNIQNTEFSSFLEDARRFMLAYRSAIEQTPLQIYHAGLIFAPRKSTVRVAYQQLRPPWILQSPRVQEHWSALLATLEGHSSSVTSVAFSPDGKRVASGSWDETVRLWDAESGEAITTLEGHSDFVTSVAFSPDGKRVASGSVDKTVRLWDAELSEAVATLEGHSNSVTSVAFSPDGKRVVSGSDDKIIRLWDAELGEALATLEGHSYSVTSVAFSPDGKRVVSGSDDKTIRLWDAESGEAITTLEGHSDSVTSVAFSPDGKRVASGSVNEIVRLWDAESGEAITTLEGHSHFVTSVAFSPDGKRVASGSRDRTVRLWDAESGEAVATLEGHSNSVTSVAFSPDGKRVASGSRDKIVRLWDAESGEAITTLEGHSDSVTSVAFSPDGKRVASGSVNEIVRLWDAESGEAIITLEGHSDSVTSVAFSPDGKRVASGSVDETVRLWDAKSGEAITTLEGHSYFVTSVAFSPDGKRVASGSRDKIVRLWDAESGEAIITLEGHSDSVTSVAFSPDGKRVASGSWDRTVRLWDAESGEAITTLEGHSHFVTSVAFSPDGKRVASGSRDKTVRLWDAESGEVVATLGGYTDSHQLTFSPNGSLLELSNTHPQASQQISRTDLYVSDQWILLGSQRLIWLPVEYRPSCKAVKEQRIILGHESGLVSVFHFDISRI